MFSINFVIVSLDTSIEHMKIQGCDKQKFNIELFTYSWS